MLEVGFKLPSGVKRFKISAGLRFTHDRSSLKRKISVYVWTHTSDERRYFHAAGIRIQERLDFPWLSFDVFHEHSDESSMNSRFAHLLCSGRTNLIAELLELVEAI